MNTYSVCGSRSVVDGVPSLKIIDPDDEVIAVVAYGNGSDKQHAAAYKVARAMVWGLNNYEPKRDRTENRL